MIILLHFELITFRSCSVSSASLQQASLRLKDLKLSDDIDERCAQIEQALNGAALHSEFDRDLNEANGPTQTEIKTFTEQRRTTPHRNTTERRILSKLIQREVKAQKKIERRAQINTILENFKGLKQIASIKTRQNTQTHHSHG